MGDPRFRLEGNLQALAVGFDQTARSVEEPGILRHWNIVTGRELSRLALSDLEIHWRFSADGQWLASAADDWTLWSVTTGDAIYTRRPNSWVTALAFGRKGDWLATGHDNGQVQLWDARQGKLIRCWQAGEAAIVCLCFSPEGNTLAIGDAARQLHLWNVSMGLWQCSWLGHTDHVTSLTWHPQGRFLVSTGWDTTARLWDAKTGDCLYVLNGHADQVQAAAFSARQSLLATVDSEHVIRIWDPFHGKVVARWHGHTRDVTQLAFAPDGRWLLSGGSDGRLLLWDVRTGRPAGPSSEGQLTGMRLATHPSGQWVAANTGGRTVHFWQMGDGRQLAGTTMPSDATALAYAPDGQLLAVGLARGVVEIVDGRSGVARCRLELHRTRVSQVRFHPTEPLLASSGGADGYLALWRLDQSDPILLIPDAVGRGFIEDFAFVPGTSLIVSVGLDAMTVDGMDGWMKLWNYGQPSLAAEAALGARRVAVHPEGTLAAVALLDDTIGLLELPSLKLVAEIAGHAGLVTALAFPRHGQWFVSAGEDGTLRWWSPTGKPLATVELDLPIRDLVHLDERGGLLTAHANGAIFFLDTSNQVARV
ncbi:MAG TPA: WD40 repeat domain-containing protein [Gemmatales bacterium]|nr:WD40 repeat domain-containing protein [Gemmatales bacterium]HMP58803.1 WD40 repeat domain-containing protein [Gemmatales bacterium]